MRRKVLLFSFVALAAVLMMSLPLAGQAGPQEHDGMGVGERLKQRLKKLDLSPEQNKKIQAIMNDAKEARQSRRQKIEKATDELHDLLQGESPSESAIMAQADKIGTLKTEAHKSMLQMLLKVRAELTPEQRVKLKSMRSGADAPPRRDKAKCGKDKPCPE